MRIRIFLLPWLVLFASAFSAERPVPVAASVESVSYNNPVIYSGQGLIADQFGGFDLRIEICGVENGAEVDGPYFLWVLTATKATRANISGPWGTEEMVKVSNGTFKYVSSWYAPSSLPANVSATYDGQRTNAQLTISHGCRPFLDKGAWCSPGFWRNATTDAAWALTGYLRSDLFNQTVYPGGMVPPLAPTRRCRWC